MSYYPHNQPIMVAIPNANGCDTEDSLDMPRSSSQSGPGAHPIMPSREHSRSPSRSHSGSGGDDGSRAASPVPVGQAIEYQPSIYADMPTLPDRAYTRQPVVVEGGVPLGVGQSLPRLTGNI